MNKEMLSKVMVGLLIAVLVAVPMVISCAAPAKPAPGATPTPTAPAPAPKAEVQQWKSQSWETAAMAPEVWANHQKFCDDVRLMTQGLLDIKHYEAESIVPEEEMLDAVGRDAIQLCSSYAHLWSGKNTAFQLLSTSPFGLSMDAHNAWFAAGDGQKYMDILYKPYNVKPLPADVGWLEPMCYSRTPITSLEDMKKFKAFRSGPGVQLETWQRVGVNAIWLPGLEIYPALERGVIDATKYGAPSEAWGLKLHEIAPYIMGPSWQSPGGCHFDFLFNLDRWNALPDYVKVILKTATAAVGLRSDVRLASEGKYWQMYKDYGCVFTKFPVEDVAKLKKAADQVISEEAEKNPLFKEILQNQQALGKTLQEYLEICTVPYIE